MSIERFSLNYLKKLTCLLDVVDVSVFSKMMSLLEETALQRSRIYLLGNGGSAATAAHMANDLGGGLNRRNIRYFNIVNLSDNAAVCTALANDVGYENVFYFQLKEVLNPNDILIAFSCSGNSPNIIKAVEYAKAKAAKVIGITGFDGGQLAKLSDINFHIETSKGEYGLVEDIHMILNHIIYSYYVHEFGESV